MLNSVYSTLASVLIPRQVKNNYLDETKLKWIDDGDLHVILPGTGSPIADPTRAGPCAVILAGGEYLVVDVGQRSYNRQQTMGLPVDKITGILLTHFHSDHICELGETLTMSWVGSGRDHKLPVYGPPGVEQVVEGFTRAYEQDSVYREEHHGVEKAGMERANAAGIAVTIPLPGGDHSSMENTVVFERNGLKVVAFNVDHRPVLPAYGYRFEYNGRVVVITGDTSKCNQLVKYSAGADVLVSEASSCHVLHHIIDSLHDADTSGSIRNAHLVEDIIDYHIDVQDVVNIAAKCQVPVLALTHLVPPPRDSWLLEKMWLSKLIRPSTWTGQMLIGKDGDAFHLAKHSTNITMVNLVASGMSIFAKQVGFVAALYFLFRMVRRRSLL
jgi:ribonuclease Z